jgi:hypothetical protein
MGPTISCVENIRERIVNKEHRIVLNGKIWLYPVIIWGVWMIGHVARESSKLSEKVIKL